MIDQPLLQIDQLPVALPRAGGHRSPQTAPIPPLSLDFAAGKFHVLAGPALPPLGHLLRLIGGFESLAPNPRQERPPQIRLRGRQMQHLPLGARNIASLGWEPRLFPHLTLGRNIVFPLTHQSADAKRDPGGRNLGDPATAAAGAALRVGLTAPMLDLYPADLPMAVQLRGALARALALSPGLLLLTDPLLALSGAEAMEFAQDLRRLQRSLGLTVLCATTRLPAWAPLADDITVFDAPPAPHIAAEALGPVLQRGSAEDIYQRPAGLLAARLGGGVNLLPVEILGRDDIGQETERLRLRCAIGEPREIALPLRQVAPALLAAYRDAVAVRPNTLPGYIPSGDIPADEMPRHYRASLLLRPAAFRPGLGIRRQDCRIDGRILDRYGDGALLTLQIGVTAGDGAAAAPLTVTLPAPAPFPLEPGMVLGLGWNLADSHLLPAA
ncbi:MAG: hypothetical protein ABWY00_11955 [Dongiaceae bacterium]